jgi:hypothetical protein
MRLPVAFVTLAVLAIDWISSSPVFAKSIATRDKDDPVLDYFRKLLPVANDTILHELGGPAIGAAVTHLLLSARKQFPDLFFFDSPVLFSPSCLSLSMRIGQCSGSATPLSSGISGSIGLLSPATPFFGRLWMTQSMLSSGLNTLLTVPGMSSLGVSQKGSMTVKLRKY